MAFRDSTTTLGLAANNTVVQLTDAQRDAATQGAQLTELVQSMYSLVLYDTQTDTTLVRPGLDPGGRTDNAEYFFRVPPKVHEFDEPFATTITNTQDAGKYVESYGSIVKSIRVSGTTGLRPNKSSSPVIPLLGVNENQLQLLLGSGINSNIRRIPRDEKTGHDDIIFLRNLFRSYSDLKSSDQLASRVVMLWRNLKDADYWVVEPEDFKLMQNSASPLTYEYNIALKTLARFDFAYVLAPDPLEEARSHQRMFARLQEYSQNLLNVFLTISNQLNRLQGFATFLSNVVMGPLLAVINGLNAVKSTAFGVVRGLRNQVLTLQANLTDAIDQLVDVTAIQDPVVRNLRRSLIICALLLTETPAAERDVVAIRAALERRARAYETPGSSTTARRGPSSSPSYIGSEPAPGAVGTATVGAGEDLRDIAFRLLGDRARWRILATLNRLRSPFIGPLGGTGLLAPGDSILYPSDSTQSRSSAVVGTQNPTTDETNGDPQANTPGQQSYGRDLRLRSTFFGGDEITDVQVNQRGDLGSVQGIPNVQQAIRIKFITGRGELPAHAKFGAKFPIGRKATPSSFNELRLNTLHTLLSDKRVTDVRDLRFSAVGDTLAVLADVVVADSQDVLSTSFALRRF